MKLKERLKKVKVINDLVTAYKVRQRRVSYGKENPDKTFFVIRRSAPTAGLFSFVTSNLGWICYAQEKGYIPIVDMQSIKNTYLSAEDEGRKNAWEFYFEQPQGYRLKDIKNSRNVILSALGTPPSYPDYNISKNKNEYEKWHALAEKYLRIRKPCKDKIDKLCEEMFEGERVLGVLCRGTDYANAKPSKHPIQPEPAAVIEKARQVMEEYHCRYLYLATEDENIHAQFLEEFADKLRFCKTKRFAGEEKRNINLLAEQSGEIYGTAQERGENYLMEIGVLANCNCLVAGSAGGTYGALLLSKGYEYQYIFRLGLYP